MRSAGKRKPIRPLRPSWARQRSWRVVLRRSGTSAGWAGLALEPPPPSSPPQPERIIAAAAIAANFVPDSSLMTAPLRIWQPRYPRAIGRGPEALRPRLATGLLLTIYDSGRLLTARFGTDSSPQCGDDQESRVDLWGVGSLDGQVQLDGACPRLPGSRPRPGRPATARTRAPVGTDAMPLLPLVVSKGLRAVADELRAHCRARCP